MGIRESLKQPQPEKLQDFVIEEEPRNELEFDVKKEITPEIWAEAKVELEYYRNQKDWEHFSFLAMSMAILQPEKKSELNIEDSWVEMLWEFTKQVGLDTPIRLARNMSLLEPDYRDELAIESKWEVAKLLLKSLDVLDGGTDTLLFLQRTFNLYVIQPNRRKDLEFSGDVWLAIKKVIHKPAFSAWLAAMALILEPTKKNELNINSDTWKKMYDRLRTDRRDNQTLLPFVEQALSMYILSAEDIRITDQGLELIMPERKSVRQQIPKRPERRAF